MVSVRPTVATASTIRSAIYYLTFSALLLVTGIVFPEYNWDVIPYVACARMLTTNNPVDAHTYAYTMMRSEKGTRHYAEGDPATDTPYRMLMRTSPTSFAHVLPYYRVRIGYIALLAGIAASGVNIVLASHAISAIAVAAALMLLFLSVRQRVGGALLYLLPPATLALGYLATSRLSTPDGLALFVLACCVHLYLNEHWGLALMLPVLVLVRTDLVLLVLLIAGSAFVLNRGHRHGVLVSTCVSLAFYFFLNWYFAYPGWASIFHFQFIDKLALTNIGRITPGWYFTSLERGIWDAVHSPGFLLFFLVSSGSVYIAWKKFRHAGTSALRSPAVHLLAIALAYSFVRMLLFPLPEIRFFSGAFVLSALALCLLLARGRSTSMDSPLPQPGT